MDCQTESITQSRDRGLSTWWYGSIFFLPNVALEPASVSLSAIIERQECISLLHHALETSLGAEPQECLITACMRALIKLLPNAVLARPCSESPGMCMHMCLWHATSGGCRGRCRSVADSDELAHAACALVNHEAVCKRLLGS